MSISMNYSGAKDALAMKDVFAKTLKELCEIDQEVVYLDADLMNSMGTLKFARENPDKAFNVGVAEANMIGIAAGLSAQGFKPYVHTFGPFASRRCYDQVFLSVGYAQNSVKIIGSDAGVTAAYNGGTHMPFEDVALYRAIPGATVIDVTDAVMFNKVLHLVKDVSGVVYIRTSRKDMTTVYGESSVFELDKAVELVLGKDVTILASGIMVVEALEAAKKLKEQGIEATVANIFTIKPLDEEYVVECAKRTDAIVTAENHNVIGGLGSAVADCLARKHPTILEMVGVNDEFGEVGPQDYLQERFKLTAEEIVRKAKAAVGRK